MTTTPTRERSLAEIESELAQARVDLATAEEAEQRAFDRVSRSREDHQLGRLARAALLGVNRELANAQNRTEELKSLIRGLDRIGTQERERIALERARTAGVALAGWQKEAAALEGWTADVIAGTIDAFERIDSAFAELHQRSGGKLGGRTKGPADMRRVHGALIASLHELRRYYSNTTKGA